MYSTSIAFQQAIKDRTRNLECRVIIKTLDATYEIEKDEIVSGSLSVSSTIMERGFEVGTCYASNLVFSLDNDDGRWDAVDLDGATVFPYCGIVLPDGTIELVPMGVFIIDNPSRPYYQLRIEASDRMILLDEPLSDLGLSAPVSVRNLLQSISTHCFVPLGAHALQVRNADYVIKELPGKDKQFSCRDAVSEIAALAGCYARMSRLGVLEFVSLSKPKYLQMSTWGDARRADKTWAAANGEGLTWLKLGGLPGRTTWEKVNTDSVTWRALTEHDVPWGLLTQSIYNDAELSELHVMPNGSRFSFKQTSDKVKISGLAYKDALWGTDEYLLELNEFELLADDDADRILAQLFQEIEGLEYTAYDADYPGNPAVDCGDVVWHLTRDGKSIASYITAHKYSHGKKSVIRSEAKSKSEQGYKSANARRLASIASKTEDVARDLTAYELASSQLSDMMGMMMGIYPSEEILADGSKVLYWHDKPDRLESKNIWKFNGLAFASSTDGGITWPTGITNDSNLIVRNIQTIGINADWVYLAKTDGTSETIRKSVTDIQAGKITLSSQTNGKLAGLTIASTSLSIASLNSFFKIQALAGSDFIQAGTSASALKFRVDSSGILHADGAKISGDLITYVGSYKALEMTAANLRFYDFQDVTNPIKGSMFVGRWTSGALAGSTNIGIQNYAGSSFGIFYFNGTSNNPYIVFDMSKTLNPIAAVSIMEDSFFQKKLQVEGQVFVNNTLLIKRPYDAGTMDVAGSIATMQNDIYLIKQRLGM